MLRTPKDFAAFDRSIIQAHERCPLRILSYCLMGNHWHFVAWLRDDGELTAFFRWRREALLSAVVFLAVLPARCAA